MEFKVLSVLKKFIPTEQYEALEDDFKKVEVELNTDINKYVTANTPKMEDLVSEAQKTAHQEVITALKIDGVETVEQLNKHIETVKLATTEDGKALSKLQLEFDKVNGKYEAEVESRTKLETEQTLAKQMSNIKKYLGDKASEKDIEFLHWDLSKTVTEELPFDEVLKTYEEANPPPKEQKWVDPRFSRKPIQNTGAEDGYAIYQKLKKEGKI